MILSISQPPNLSPGHMSRGKVPGLKFTGHLGNSQVIQSIMIPDCRSKRQVNQGSTERIHDDAGQTGSVPLTSATRCPGAAVNSPAALSTACLSRPSCPVREGRPTSAGHRAFPKIRVGQVRFPFKRDGLPSTHLFLQQKACFRLGAWPVRKIVSREQHRQDPVLTGLVF